MYAKWAWQQCINVCGSDGWLMFSQLITTRRFVEYTLYQGYKENSSTREFYARSLFRTVSALAISKKHTPDKWRVIVNLSFPEQHNVNDGIDPALSSLSYIWVEQVAPSVLEQGPGAQLAKIDIKSTYRKVLIHPDDRPSPGTYICTLYAVEQPPNVHAASPFGLCSASIVYTSSMQSQMSSSGLLSTWA